MSIGSYSKINITVHAYIVFASFQDHHNAQLPTFQIHTTVGHTFWYRIKKQHALATDHRFYNSAVIVKEHYIKILKDAFTFNT